MNALNVMGVLVLHSLPNGDQMVTLVAPDHMYITVPMVATPDAWLPVVAQLSQQSGVTVLGVLADGGVL